VPTPRLRHTARALLLDANDRLLLARHDLTSRHYGRVLWAPPGGGLNTGETPIDAVLRELVEEVGYEATADEVRHVWHQEIVSPSYSKDWDGAIHDYFLVRCQPFRAEGTWTPEQLLGGEGITEFRWWTLADMNEMVAPEVFGPRQLPALLRDLLSDGADAYPIRI
jgi:ADP-ribose pyrophosphatase YjhB (NUDIX family)